MEEKFKKAKEAYDLGYTEVDEENLFISNGKYTFKVDEEICKYIKKIKEEEK